MGYESKVYVVDVHRHGDKWIYAEKLAEMNLCCMGYKEINGKSFTNLFADPIDYTLWICRDGCRKEVNEDCYGEHIKAGDPHEIIEWLKSMNEIEPYRRIQPLIGMLEGYLDGDWDDLEILHYGY